MIVTFKGPPNKPARPGPRGRPDGVAPSPAARAARAAKSHSESATAGVLRPDFTAFLPVGRVGAQARAERRLSSWSAMTPTRMTAPITAKLSDEGMPSRLTRFWST